MPDPFELSAFLNLNGNCREAMRFYGRCLGGQLSFQEPDAQLRTEDANIERCVLAATLQKERLLMMGTDLSDEQSQSNPVGILLRSPEREQLWSCYEELSQQATITDALKENSEGRLAGELTDRFGVHWVFLETTPGHGRSV